tara:strand:+ start:97 stop:651 length:555 start_codon:yes stop_codon:yes gene_type:complete
MWTKHGLPNTAVLLAVFLKCESPFTTQKEWFLNGRSCTHLRTATIAVDCGIGLTYPIFSNQEELDNVVANCTVWIGSIKVATDWNGPLVLNNIVNLTGYFTLETSSNNSYRPSQFLTSIEAPELRYLGFLDLWGLSNLTAITLPRLEQVQSLTVGAIKALPIHLDAPSLVSITDELEIIGNLPM